MLLFFYRQIQLLRCHILLLVIYATTIQGLCKLIPRDTPGGYQQYMGTGWTESEWNEIDGFEAMFMDVEPANLLAAALERVLDLGGYHGLPLGGVAGSP